MRHGRLLWSIFILLVLFGLCGLVGCEGEESEVEGETEGDEVSEADGEGADAELLKAEAVGAAFLEVVEAVDDGDYDSVTAMYTADSLAFFETVYAENPELGSAEEDIAAAWSAHRDAFGEPFEADDYRVRNLNLDTGTAEVHWRYPDEDGELENATFFALEDGAWKLSLELGATPTTQ